MTEAVTPPNPGGKGGADSGPRGMIQSTPDPTLLTIDSIRREIAMVNESTESAFIAVEKLTNEKFHRVDERLNHAEDLRKEQKADTKAAVDAALQSQIEATQKMEKSISDQLNSLRHNFETSIGGVHTSVNDLKERMTILESKKEGQQEQKSETRQVAAGVYAAIGISITILLAILALVGFIAGNAA